MLQRYVANENDHEKIFCLYLTAQKPNERSY